MAYFLSTMKNILIVMLGGGVGSALRYLTADLVKKYMPVSFPVATLLVNIAGSLLIGFVLGYALQHQRVSGATVLLLTMGFCGGFTTFSTFAMENLLLLQNGQTTVALVNITMSVVGGICAVWLGILSAKLVLA